MCTVEPKVTLISLSVNLKASCDAGTLLRPSAKRQEARSSEIASSQVSFLVFSLFLRLCLSTCLRQRYVFSRSRNRLEHFSTWYCLMCIALLDHWGPWSDAMVNRNFSRISFVHLFSSKAVRLFSTGTHESNAVRGI
jgi:hypothetical protein